MSTSIIPQLVRKDFLMMRKMILICCVVMLASIAAICMMFGRVPKVVFFNLGFTLLITPAFTCGIILLMKTIVMEKQKSTQLFIMSLPVTVREFTIAKLFLNFTVFTVFWLVFTSVAFYFMFGLGVFPYGAVPFFAVLFLGIFVAYVGTLSVALIYQSYGITILTMLGIELVMPAYFWAIAYLKPIYRHIGGPHMVWNSTAIGVVALPILIAILISVITWHIQSKKRDFI